MAVTFTNKHNLPESFVNAILTDEHVSLGDISVTQLIDAPQIRMLKKTNDYELDVMDMVTMAIGTGVHTVLERGDLKGVFNSRVLQQASGILLELGEEKGAAYLVKVIKDKLEQDIDDDVIVEKTLTMEILGWTISGTFDRYTRSLKKLEDYKTTGASAVMFPETKKSWDAQQNIYAVMLRANDLEVEIANIVAILKDWSKMKIMTNKDYPRTPVIIHPIKLIDQDRMMKYIESRVNLHQRAEAGEDIPCTPKDRWAKKDTYKVKKKGGKRSMRNCDSELAAQAYIEKNKDKIQGEVYIEHVPAESFRCKNGYCPVADVCPQYKEEKEEAARKSEKI